MRLLAITLLTLILALTAFAQGNTGTINGTVSDTSHAGIAGASIEAKNVETGSVHRGLSGPGGNYILSQLPPGKYELSVSSFGFKPYERKDIVVQPGQQVRVDVPIGDFISLDTLGEDRNGILRMFMTRPQPPTGPTPRTADGKPDMSGLWYGPLPAGAGQGEQPELLPWAAAVAKERMDNNFKDNPGAHCLPFNVQMVNVFLNKLVQTRDSLTIIIEYDIPGYRQVHLDGRPHPKDFDPSWTGHSVGTWDGDTLVVETVGFNDKTWLGEANPHTDKLKLTTRLRRPDLGHLEIETIFEDPGSMKKPWKTKGVATLAPPTEEILEFICNENNQDAQHLVGK
jgi:hypothetical protein